MRNPPQASLEAKSPVFIGVLRTVPKSTFVSSSIFVNRICRLSTGFSRFSSNLFLFTLKSREFIAD